MVPSFVEGVVGDVEEFHIKYLNNRKNKASTPRLMHPVVGHSTKSSSSGKSSQSTIVRGISRTTPRDIEHLEPFDQPTTKQNYRARIPRQVEDAEVVEEVVEDVTDISTDEEPTYEPENLVLSDEGFTTGLSNVELTTPILTAAPLTPLPALPPTEAVPPKIDEYCLECDDSPSHIGPCDFNSGAFINT
jgi:hypothetical protein